MDYKTSLDAPAKALTWAVCALFGMLALYQLYTYSRSPRETVDAVAAAVQIAFFVGVVLFSYLYSPQGYSVHDGALVIHRPWKPVTIPLSEIRSGKTPRVASSFSVAEIARAAGSTNAAPRMTHAVISFAPSAASWRTSAAMCSGGRLCSGPRVDGTMQYVQNLSQPIMMRTYAW